MRCRYPWANGLGESLTDCAAFMRDRKQFPYARINKTC